MKKNNMTVEEYIEQIPDRWRPMIEEVRKQISESIDSNFIESFRWGMITYEIPMEISGPTYNKQPLSFIALSVKRSHCSLYLMPIYASPEKQDQLRQAFADRGLLKNMRKSCIRFKRIEDMPLDVILSMLTEFSVEDYRAITQP